MEIEATEKSGGSFEEPPLMFAVTCAERGGQPMSSDQFSR